ncbi:hypothetical protein GDO86_004882 [Hymenochirus boettgeri]|uniref:Uncharacterized protein n=1 Tax=Hymenochirus boettgeri TaxID=247094 RepID=A0A8T2IZK8_9PIPI|nr:hypothetical protein GDO86_004882 [Hymenochirus boettgeri]
MQYCASALSYICTAVSGEWSVSILYKCPPSVITWFVTSTNDYRIVIDINLHCRSIWYIDGFINNVAQCVPVLLQTALPRVQK